MIDAAAIRELAAHAKAQLLDGVEALKCGNITLAELHLSLSLITQRKLLGILEDADAPATKPPLRKLALVQVGTAAVPHDPEIAPWMESTHGEPDDGDAA